MLAQQTHHVKDNTESTRRYWRGYDAYVAGAPLLSIADEDERRGWKAARAGEWATLEYEAHLEFERDLRAQMAGAW